jgi:hypothetical protein
MTAETLQNIGSVTGAVLGYGGYRLFGCTSG